MFRVLIYLLSLSVIKCGYESMTKEIINYKILRKTNNINVTTDNHHNIRTSIHI